MNAFCTNLDGGFVCHCPSAFTGNPYTICYPDGKTMKTNATALKNEKKKMREREREREKEKEKEVE